LFEKVRSFGRTYNFHLQGPKISQERNQQEEDGQLPARFLIGLLFDPEEGDGMFIRNVGFSEVPGVTTQNSVLFITTAIRILNAKAELDHGTI
jgi:hypothetical protein